jgi:putative polyketide hydroxylase
VTADADVLVVGGGPTGLTAAGFLALNGCRVLLVERHRSTSRHPKARLANARSMDLIAGSKSSLCPAVRSRWSNS